MPKGKRSGGPRTPEGKLVASRNSLKTGVYSTQQFLPGERPEDFEELQARFVEDLKPVGIVEASLVQELTTLAWKKLRLDRVENQFLYGVLNATPTPEELFAAGLPRKEDIIWLLGDLTVMTESFVRDHERYLAWAQQAKKVGVTQESIDQLKDRDPDLHAYLRREALSPHANSEKVHVVVFRWKGE